MTFLRLANTVVGATILGKVRDFATDVAALPNLMSWYRPEDALAGVIDVSGTQRVQQWSPHAGAGTFDQSTEGKRPAYLANAGDGRPAVSFKKGRVDQLVYGGTFPTGATSRHTKVMLVRIDPEQAGSAGFFLSNVSNTSGRHTLEMFASGQINQKTGTSLVASHGALPTDQWHLLIGSFTGSATAGQSVVRLKVNDGSTIEALGDGTPTVSQLYMGTSTAGSAGGISMDVRDTLVFDDDLLAPSRAADLETLLGYFQSRYNLSLL